LVRISSLEFGQGLFFSSLNGVCWRAQDHENSSQEALPSKPLEASQNLANKSVLLNQSKTSGGWGRAEGMLHNLPEGSYHVSYYDRAQKRMESVGP
jgi:hypothetical protein